MSRKSITLQALKWEVTDADDGTIIYIHGLSKKNKRVIVKIPDFKPYVYLELDSRVKWTSNRIELLRSFLRKTLYKNYPIKSSVVDKKKNYYFRPGKFIWMAFNNKTAIRALQRAVGGEINIYGLGKIKLTVHEHRADSILQLFAMRKVKPAGWIVAKQTTKNQLLEEHVGKFSTADIEIISSFKDISPAKNVSTVTNPFVVSYDIECVSGDKSGNTFPNPTRMSDQVICISATAGFIQDDEHKWKTYALVNEVDNKKCPDDLKDGSEVRHFKNEKELLLGWSAFINELDPDVITGYNTLTFDDNYMTERANTRLCWPKFSKMGRILEQRSKTEERKWASSAYGDQQFNYIDIPGRLHIDMYPVIAKDFTSLMSYTLNFVSEHFLEDSKVDLPANEMIRIWHRGDVEDIRKIVIYCNQDTRLPLRLMKKLNSWIGLAEMSNVVMVPIFDLVTRGQQIRVFSQVYCLAFDLGVVCCDKWSDYKPTDEEKLFVGATVQTPLAGYWELVATYDFKSLYPTSIIAYNLCFSTFVPVGENPPADQYNTFYLKEHQGCEHDKTVRKTKPTRIICRDHTERFYKSSVKQGIIPMLLENILAARARTRKEHGELAKRLKNNEIPNGDVKQTKLTLDVLDKRQLGLKISANSMYGGFGSDYSYSPCYPAAATTTAMGRKSIQDAIDFANDYRPDTIVVYGDSVTQDTPVLLKNPYGDICVEQISHLAIDCEWKGYRDFKLSFVEPVNSDIEYHVADDGANAIMAARHMFNADRRWDKEHKLIEGWEAWTDQGWSVIKQVIRHKTAKKIYRVTTHTGTVDVTQDHSLLTDSGEQVKPINTTDGQLLLHNYPYKVNCSEHFDDYHSDKFDAAKTWLLLKKCGYNVYLETIGDSIHLYNNDVNIIQRNAVISTVCLGSRDEYVYDLETERGNFQAGVGELIVKNTDSCMLKFNNVTTLKKCFEVCGDLEKKINDIFPKPMYLELEKIYSKYFILSKKRYVGYMVDPKGTIYSVDKKGVVIKRRDNCGYLREIYTKLIDMVMDKEPKWKMFKYLCEKIDTLLAGNVELESLVITKSIKDSYKAQNLPHVAVAKKMRERGKYVASGTRVRYIFMKTAKYSDPQYIKAEDPDYYLQHKDTMEIDYLYYFEKQLVNPIDEVISVKFGVDNVLKNLLRLLKKDICKSASEYFYPKFKIAN